MALAFERGLSLRQLADLLGCRDTNISTRKGQGTLGTLGRKKEKGIYQGWEYRPDTKRYHPTFPRP